MDTEGLPPHEVSTPVKEIKAGLVFSTSAQDLEAYGLYSLVERFDCSDLKH
jgi:hypothetical protein